MLGYLTKEPTVFKSETDADELLPDGQPSDTDTEAEPDDGDATDDPEPAQGGETEPDAEPPSGTEP